MDDAGSAIPRLVTLPGKGSTVVVWDCPGPPGAPTLVLLHGVTLTAELKWSAVLPVLGRHFRVLACDQRGHGRGLACAGPYRPGGAGGPATETGRRGATGPAGPAAGLTAS